MTKQTYFKFTLLEIILLVTLAALIAMLVMGFNIILL